MSFCGGGYVKLMGSDLDQKSFGPDTAYKIMRLGNLMESRSHRGRSRISENFKRCFFLERLPS